MIVVWTMATLSLSACGGDDEGSAPTTSAMPASSVDAITTTVVPTTTLPPTYVLQPGDSPSLIADKFGVTVEELAAANLGDPNYERFLVGAEINLPTSVTTLPPAPTTPTTPTTLPTAVDGRVTLAFTGDLVAHRAVNRYAAQPDGTYRYHGMFDNVQPFLSAHDLAVCHMEQPMAPPGQEVIVPPPALSIDAAVVPALADAGYDWCSTASNHSLDRGAAGVDATVAAFDNTPGIGQSGMATSAGTRLPEVLTVNGVRVALLSYTFSYNGIPPIRGEEWRSNIIDPALVISDARAMRQRGAQAVIVSFHWGVEKVVQPTSSQREVAEAVTASGEVDLIVGHHAHVLQPIEQVNGVWVIYGMGNILSNHPTSSEWPASSQDAAVFTTALQRNADGSISVERPQVHATWCDTDNGYLVRFTAEADDPNSPISASMRAELQVSEQRTRDLLGDYMAP